MGNPAHGAQQGGAEHPTHRTPPSGWRSLPLPPDWPSIVKRILERDPKCMIRTHCWGSTSIDVDHIGNPADHSDDNLRGACEPCHDARSARQGADAAKRARARATGRTTKPHPGLR